MTKERHVKTLAAAVATAALVLPASAFAHAELTPPVGLAGRLELYTLAVPTEKEGAATTSVELTVPAGFGIDSFQPSPGWTRRVRSRGSGEAAVVQKVTWTGGSVPTGEDAVFSFLASASSARTYTFSVRQTYSDGSVVDWNGPESSDTPSPSIEARTSFGGGGGSTLAVVAIALAAAALLLAGLALVSGKGRSLA
ncbi:MAG TPA: DUF1775 domain-containing protein [Gaiellaceae bacterium]|nr:DUF1775 domain-containing protein [Gaiellaceae bacterium]